MWSTPAAVIKPRPYWKITEVLKVSGCDSRGRVPDLKTQSCPDPQKRGHEIVQFWTVNYLHVYIMVFNNKYTTRISALLKLPDLFYTLRKSLTCQRRSRYSYIHFVKCKKKEYATFRRCFLCFIILTFFPHNKCQAHLECHLDQHLEVEVAVPLELRALEPQVLVSFSRVDMMTHQVLPMSSCSRCWYVKSATDWD
jgi:hypothetical protein